MLTEEVKLQIKGFSLQNSNEETCGLILLKDNKYIVYPCKNISYYKANHAILNPLDYVRASKIGRIVAHFHSHPESDKPSFMDYLSAVNHNLYSVIYSIKSNKFYIIEPKLSDYLNLDYKCGISDCYSLIRNYFNKELNIKINDYNREEKWWEKEPDLIINNIKNEGGIEVEYKDLKINDLILFSFNGALSHFSIYLGNDMILHHPVGDKSIISELNDSLKRRISKVIRHKDLF
jgi:cell wall-associated NlpC family hydrolase